MSLKRTLRHLKNLNREETRLEKIRDYIEDKVDTVFGPIGNAYRTVKYGIRNIWRFRKVIWEFRPWDQSYLLNIMEKTFTEMVKAHEPGHLVKAPRTAKELKMAALLCKRLSEDNYYDKQHREYFEQVIMGFKPVGNGLSELVTEYKIPHLGSELERKHRVIYKLEAKVKKHDLKLLSKLIERHLFDWWD